MFITYSPRTWFILKALLGSYFIYFFASSNSLFDLLLSPNGLFSHNITWEKINWLKWLNFSNYSFFWILGVIWSLGFILANHRVFKGLLYFWWVSWCIAFPFYLFPPHIAYLGFTLLFTLFFNEKSHRIPKVIYNSFVWVWGLGFTVSGLMKLLYSSSWQEGLIVQIISSSPLGYSFLEHLPMTIGQGLSYMALGIELLSFPLVLYPKTQKIGLWSMVILQMGILCTMNIPDLTIGMLLGLAFLLAAQPKGEPLHE